VVDLLDLLISNKVMAIVRAPTAERAKILVNELAVHGVKLMEITLNTPGALDLIAATSGEFKTVGAGTVLTVTDARDAVAAGAAYLVTPAVIPAVLEEAGRLDTPVICGASSPTEVLQAWQGGATAVKVFPASLGGPAYLAALLAPLPDIPLVAVGGVEIDDVPEYLNAGAIAVGIGSPLTNGDIAERCDRLWQALA
jgi:2-dehydro-3-deoxyphosphogluconate aldolase/(4S)-4-hydroxy-2-oxoglutarate aldolase